MQANTYFTFYTVDILYTSLLEVLITKDDLKKYGFKNQLLGRLTVEATTELPTLEQMFIRISGSKDLKAFCEQMKSDGFEVGHENFEDKALLEIVQVASNPMYGMRALPAVLAAVKQRIVFSGDYKPGVVTITGQMIKKVKTDKNLGS